MPTATLGREPTEAIPNTCPLHRRKQVLGDALNIHNGFMIKNKYNTVSIAVILLAFYLVICGAGIFNFFLLSAGVGRKILKVCKILCDDLYGLQQNHFLNIF